MNIVIRKAIYEDAYEYASCHITCWLSAYSGIVSDEFLSSMPGKIDQRAEMYKQAFTNPGNCEYYCVELGEKMIGFLCLGKSTDEDKPNAGDVIAIYLLEEYWGKGHGKKMMKFSVDRLKQLGYNEIILWTFQQNTRAR